MQLSVKDVDASVFKEFKAESVRDGLKIGKGLTLAMEFWLRNKNQKKKASILDFEPSLWEKETAKVSEKLDDVVYE
ncbi:hypothetical protein CMO92_03095 [Candidatus Woesearchaeota archaeon]|nr:hypothetical protein [Candidatus Woesearchaeota archaeon]|tara:strand:- start:1632 stop:1859 length:228 start_codon:yes stop_codon:yes gene_type:complete